MKSHPWHPCEVDSLSEWPLRPKCPLADPHRSSAISYDSLERKPAAFVALPLLRCQQFQFVSGTGAGLAGPFCIALHLRWAWSFCALAPWLVGFSWWLFHLLLVPKSPKPQSGLCSELDCWCWVADFTFWPGRISAFAWCLVFISFKDFWWPSMGIAAVATSLEHGIRFLRGMARLWHGVSSGERCVGGPNHWIWHRQQSII